MKTSGRVAGERGDTGKQEKAGRIICREKARALRSIFPQKRREPAGAAQQDDEQPKPLIFYILLLILPLIGFGISIHIADSMSPRSRVLVRPAPMDNPHARDTVPTEGFGGEEAALLWYDDFEEFWNIISEPDVPLEEKKTWVDRLFRSDENGAYAYFSRSMDDFSRDAPLQAVINEVCVDHGFSAIAIHDKEGIREEFSGVLSRKWLTWILVCTPVPLVVFLAVVKALKGWGNPLAAKPH